MATEHENALRELVEAYAESDAEVERSETETPRLQAALKRAAAALRPVETVRDFGLEMTALQIDESRMRAMERTVERAVLDRTETLIDLLRRFVASTEDGKPQQGTRDLAKEAEAFVFDHDIRKARPEPSRDAVKAEVRASTPEAYPFVHLRWQMESAPGIEIVRVGDTVMTGRRLDARYPVIVEQGDRTEEQTRDYVRSALLPRFDSSTGTPCIVVVRKVWGSNPFPVPTEEEWKAYRKHVGW